MQPIVHGLEQKWGSKVAFFHVNVDAPEGEKLGSKMQIEGIPAFVFIRQGKVVQKVVGGTGEETLEQHLKSIAGQ